MKRIALLAILLPHVVLAAGESPKFAFKLTFSSASVNAAVKKGTPYSMHCTVPVRYVTAVTSALAVALIGVADGGATSFYYDTLSLPWVYFTTPSSDGYLAVIPDPAAAGYCEVFERVSG